MAALLHGFTLVDQHNIATPIATGLDPVFADWISFWPRVVGANGNTGQVRVGGVPLQQDAGKIPQGSGMPLNPGDSSVAWPVRGYDLRKIYVDADNDGDGVQWVYGIL